MSKTPVVLYSEIPDGAIWCIGQHTDAERRRMERAAKRGELLKVRASWCGIGPLKTVFIPVRWNVA
jgi:hypothetical protein